MFISVNLPKKEKLSKMWFTATSYFAILTLSLTHFLVERVSSTNSVDFFFLTLVGFFHIVVLSFAAIFSSSMASSTNTYKFFWVTSSWKCFSSSFSFLL
jgi:hypothetical protein